MELIEVIQQICQSSYKAMSPTELVIGTVVGVSPLQISINTAMAPLNQSVLYLTDAVVPKTITARGEGEITLTGSKNGAGLPASGDTLTLNPALAAGDKVLLLRVQRGQKFVVLSRVY